MDIFRRFVYSLMLSSALMLVLFAAVVGYKFTRGDRLLSVQTASMIPAVLPGDAVYAQPVALQDLRIGDIIAYRSPADNRVIVSHRLAFIDYQTGRLVTKGDAVAGYDRAVPYYLVVGRVTSVMPWVGFGLDWLHTRNGLIAAVYFPAAVLLMAEIRRLTQAYHPFRTRIYRYHAHA